MKRILFYFFLAVLALSVFLILGYFYIFPLLTEWLLLVSTGFFPVIALTFLLMASAFIIPAIFLSVISFFWFYVIKRVKGNVFLNFFIITVSILLGIYSFSRWKLLLLQPGFSFPQYFDPVFHLNAYFYMAVLPLIREALFILSAAASFIFIFDLAIAGGEGGEVYRNGAVRFPFSTTMVFLI